MIKLLLVEDETATRQGLMKHIKWHELGIGVVEEAKDGIEGLEAARRLRPDIVVSDIRMPGMNGIDFTASVRERFPACKIIYLSGHSDKEYLKAAIRINAVSYVEKPINLDELQEVIAKAVQLCLEHLKADHLNLALSESLPFIRQTIVSGLIRGPIDDDELQRSLQLARVSFAPGSSYTVSILVPAHEDGEPNAIDLRGLNRIVDYLHRASNGFTHLAAIQDSARIVVISAHRPERRHELAAVYPLLAEHLSQYPPSPKVSWIVGMTSPGWPGIRASYETAAGFLSRLFYYDFGTMVDAADKPTAAYPITPELFHAYEKLLQEPNKGAILSFAEQLYQAMRTKTGTPVDDVRSLFYRMLRLLAEQGEKRGLHLSPSGAGQVEYDWAVMSKISTFKQLKDYFLRRAAVLLDRIANLESNCRAVLDVKKYIRGNYSDKEITVNMLADHVHLTPTYLSSLFRKETGKTISEYIAEVRIARSADLLMEPQSKLYEVADLSGYNDANYFAKAFKKITGMTPTQFRRKHKP
ncbi:two-component system, response regulator YesN [Paenibacillus sp. UNC496MF]|uniref:response regulator transcription factor n=1 Tax=Paenibacillus sp. UNC496MF TaxID=1502753 RepID=UPI0008EA1F94|nr:response regulator [Paenibacillus sp. UNC496MF]SFJ48597.1 two-component system, response regulator YesN [Paenibacillus sp. UNC496MF]